MAKYPVLLLLLCLLVSTVAGAGAPAATTRPAAGKSAIVPAAPGTGSLSVRTTPYGANVYIDGEMRGATPVTITGLPAGSHVLLLVMTGYQDHITVITIEPGRTTEYSTTMRENLGKTDEIGIGIPGFEQVPLPGFETGTAFAGLLICGALHRFVIPKRKKKG